MPGALEARFREHEQRFGEIVASVRERATPAPPSVRPTDTLTLSERPNGRDLPSPSERLMRSDLRVRFRGTTFRL
jgi:hypothetical protein